MIQLLRVCQWHRVQSSECRECVLTLQGSDSRVCNNDPSVTAAAGIYKFRLYPARGQARGPLHPAWASVGSLPRLPGSLALISREEFQLYKPVVRSQPAGRSEGARPARRRSRAASRCCTRTRALAPPRARARRPRAAMGLRMSRLGDRYYTSREKAFERIEVDLQRLQVRARARARAVARARRNRSGRMTSFSDSSHSGPGRYWLVSGRA